MEHKEEKNFPYIPHWTEFEETCEWSYTEADPVNRPSHYTKGKQEAIDTIEDAIADAPSMPLAFLHGQVLKYMLRLWLKSNPKEDAEKARWYLDRMIAQL